MNPATYEIIKTTLKSDMTLTPDDRKRLLLLLRQGAKAPEKQKSIGAEPRILRRSEAAKRLGVTIRAIDKWSQEGILRRVRLPGRTRGCGFLESEINTLMTAGKSRGSKFSSFTSLLISPQSSIEGSGGAEDAAAFMMTFR